MGIKTKILRKVKYPLELDITDFCTDELKNKILPLKLRLQELEKERESSKVRNYVYIYISKIIYISNVEKFIIILE
jgi:hypothetical protein